MNVDIYNFGLFVLTGVVGVLAFFIKRTIDTYDANMRQLSLNIEEFTTTFKQALIEFQKEISQIRLESALLKQGAMEFAKYSDKIAALEKANIICESQIKAAFTVLSGKRKARVEDDGV